MDRKNKENKDSMELREIHNFLENHFTIQGGLEHENNRIINRQRK